MPEPIWAGLCRIRVEAVSFIKKYFDCLIVRHAADMCSQHVRIVSVLDTVTDMNKVWRVHASEESIVIWGFGLPYGFFF